MMHRKEEEEEINSRQETKEDENGKDVKQGVKDVLYRYIGINKYTGHSSANQPLTT